MTIATPPFRKFFHVMSGVGTFSVSMHAKFEFRIFSHYGAILAFNAQNIYGVT